VGHQGQPDPIGQLPRPGERLDADATGGALVDPGLDAEDEVAIGFDDGRGQLDIPVFGVGELPRRRDQPDRGQVEQREDA
jgi:hypothetical protein